MAKTLEMTGGDNASNRDTIAICRILLTQLPRRWPARRGKHPSGLDIPTLRCDRLAAASVLRRRHIPLSGLQPRPRHGGFAMSSLPLKIFAAIVVGAFAVASPAEAAKKHKNK